MGLTNIFNASWDGNAFQGCADQVTDKNGAAVALHCVKGVRMVRLTHYSVGEFQMSMRRQ